jgi:hypothetical protein
MFSYRGKRPEFPADGSGYPGWSAHMTGGWQSQIWRVQRWWRRAVDAADPTDRLDILCAFFENAFHLRDWLLDTGTLSPEKLQAFFDAIQK